MVARDILPFTTFKWPVAKDTQWSLGANLNNYLTDKVLICITISYYRPYYPMIDKKKQLPWTRRWVGPGAKRRVLRSVLLVTLFCHNTPSDPLIDNMYIMVCMVTRQWRHPMHYYLIVLLIYVITFWTPCHPLVLCGNCLLYHPINYSQCITTEVSMVTWQWRHRILCGHVLTTWTGVSHNAKSFSTIVVHNTT